jgi:hypothetical protein
LELTLHLRERGVQVVGDIGEAPWKRELLCSTDVIMPIL